MRRNFELDALDIVDQKSLWSASFPKQGPTVTGSPLSGSVVFVLSAASDGIRGEISRIPDLQSLWDKEKPKQEDYLLEALDCRKGTFVGAAIVHTGKLSFLPQFVQAMGDWIVVGDNLNRVLLYSISTGQEKARWFGYRPQVSRNGQRLCLINGRGHLVVYNLQTLKQTQDLYFANSVSAHLLSGDGQKALRPHE